MKNLLGCALLPLLLATSVPAAESRTWTSRKGSSLEAQLVKVAAGEATLLTADGRELKLKAEDLSLADRQYLVEYGGAEAGVLAGAIGEPEKDIRLDSKTFNKAEKPMKIGGKDELDFEVLETEHFLIASTGKVRAQGVAETAERLWHGMAFVHLNFRRDWGDKKKVILLVDDAARYTALGKWYGDFLVSQGVEQMAAQQAVGAWEQVGGTSVMLDEELRKEWNTGERAMVFNVRDENLYRKAIAPFVVHMISKNLLAGQMGGISNFGSDGYFAILTGFAYFKEIQLAGQTETQLVMATGTSFDEIESVKGFDDGSSWAKTLRSLVRRGKVKADFEAMLGWKQEELDPEKLVLIYSFAHYCHSTPERLGNFANMVRRVETSNQIPEPVEIAALFGFDSVEALQNDWSEFIKSNNFK